MSIEDYKAAIGCAKKHVMQSRWQDCFRSVRAYRVIHNKDGCKMRVSNVSINEIAAHYTAEPDDETVIGEGDLVKLEWVRR